MTAPAASPLKRLIVCADDYAISPAVSAGIRELAAAGRLSATGVMTGMPAWPDEAPALKALASHVMVGLHVTLTDQRPLGPMPAFAPEGRFPAVPALVKAAFSGRLSKDGVAKDELVAEVTRQLDCFEAHFGQPPAFIDGHQHVHLLPGVAQAILSLFGRRLDPARVWLRDCTDRPLALLRRGSAAKAGFIAAIGVPLSRAAGRRGIAVNRGFSGFYDSTRESLDAALPRLLAGAGDGHLLMVHPGHVDQALIDCDSLTAPRQVEWAALMAGDLPQRLGRLGFSIAEGRTAIG